MDSARRPEPARRAESAQRPAPPLVRAAQVGDVPVLLELFGELAEYEHLTHELHATAPGLEAALFGPQPVAEALIAELGSDALGYALFFPTFSSFLTSTGVWLEDLFVRPAYRGEGVGRALLSAVAARVREQGGERLEWATLDWNELALGFYRRLGAATASEWITHRLDGEALESLASESVSRPGESAANPAAAAPPNRPIGSRSGRARPPRAPRSDAPRPAAASLPYSRSQPRRAKPS